MPSGSSVRLLTLEAKNGIDHRQARRYRPQRALHSAPCRAEHDRVCAGVIGTERHESVSIDNQLRGRSGRQGDARRDSVLPSLEDDLMRLFGGDKMDRVSKMMVTADMGDDMPISTRSSQGR